MILKEDRIQQPISRITISREKGSWELVPRSEKTAWLGTPSKKGREQTSSTGTHVKWEINTKADKWNQPRYCTSLFSRGSYHEIEDRKMMPR